jgi:hypothetical protein
VVDVDHHVSDSEDIFGVVEKWQGEVEEFLDHEAILGDQSAFAKVDAVVDDVEDEGVSTVQDFSAFIVDLPGCSKDGCFTRYPDE